MFTLEIELGNETMQTRGDVAEALRRLAGKLVAEGRDAGFAEEDTGQIHDPNGNYVGDWKTDLT